VKLPTPRVLDPIYHMPKSTTPKKKEATMTAKKPATVKPKYPVVRVPEAAEYFVVKSKTARAELIGVYDATFNALNFERIAHATTGTKLDRALVDLKEAKKRIKELEAAK
jgi:hypothetical protein